MKGNIGFSVCNLSIFCFKKACAISILIELAIRDTEYNMVYKLYSVNNLVASVS